MTKYMADGVFYSKEGFYYVIDGKKSLARNRDQYVIAKEYVKKYVQKNPKYKPLFEGKNWHQIFSIMGIKING